MIAVDLHCNVSSAPQYVFHLVLRVSKLQVDRLHRADKDVLARYLTSLCYTFLTRQK